MRSIVRRILQGVVPPRVVRTIQQPIAPNSISWEHCNIVEPDPQRRLRLNISHDALEKMHPADLADIVEELSPEDREAIILADKLGFASAFVGEHLTDACENVPNSMTFLATLIHSTTQIKLATGTCDLSQQHPGSQIVPIGSGARVRGYVVVMPE